MPVPLCFAAGALYTTGIDFSLIETRLIQRTRIRPSFHEHAASLARFSEPVEMIVLYNDEEIEGVTVAAIVSDHISSSDPDIRVRIVPAPGMAYYELKNHGVRQANGDLIPFLDSDVIPEERWLENLLGLFARPEVKVSSGNAYIDPDSFVAKSFALTWFFELPGGDARVYETGHFWANNVVFTGEVMTHVRPEWMRKHFQI